MLQLSFIKVDPAVFLGDRTRHHMMNRDRGEDAGQYPGQVQVRLLAEQIQQDEEMLGQPEGPVTRDDQYHHFGDAVFRGLHHGQADEANHDPDSHRAEHHLAADLGHIARGQLAAVQGVQADKDKHDQRSRIVEQAFSLGQDFQPMGQVEFGKDADHGDRVGRQHHSEQHHDRRAGQRDVGK